MTEKVKGQIKHIDAELKELCETEGMQMFFTLTDDDEASISHYMDNDKQDTMLTSVNIGIYELM